MCIYCIYEHLHGEALCLLRFSFWMLLSQRCLQSGTFQINHSFGFCDFFFFQVVYYYIETTTSHSPEIWSYDLSRAHRWVFPAIKVFCAVAGNSCAMEQWMHFVSLNLKQKLSSVYQFHHSEFVLQVFGEKNKSHS